MNTRQLWAALAGAAMATAFAAEPERLRPDAAALHVPVDTTREQLLLGDRIFQGEAANGKCYLCHGRDAKGTAVGNDLTLGSLIWGNSMREIKATIRHNMKMAPGQDGDLTPEDVDAVTAYVWSINHQDRFRK